jgi:hypothetical protein
MGPISDVAVDTEVLQVENVILGNEISLGLGAGVENSNKQVD